MGFVRVHGKATGEQQVTSPITGTPCYFYKVEIEKWEVKNRSGHWSHYRTDTDGVRFYLADGTGKVMVDAHAAELDLLKTGMREIGGKGLASGSPGSASSIPAGVTEEDLRRYVSQVDVRRVGSLVGRGLAALGPLSDPDKERRRQATVEMFGQGFGSPEFIQKAMELQRPLSMESMQGAQQGGLAATMHAASGRYRFTEYCLVPDQTYEVTGTCVENPNPKDEHDRNMIVKGQNEPTFLISYRTERQVESNLRRRAALYVFGGAGLSILCVALLLLKLGWL
jgi:hypothetical protein